MKNNKIESVLEFIQFIKIHNIRNDGPIDATLIENKTNYSNRHFTRMLSDYSTYTPVECAERFRLLQCVKFIEKGNSLKNAAIQFGYTPEGLSNAIRKNLKINAEMIRSGEYDMGKNIEINQLWKHIDNYQLQFKIEDFIMFLEALDEEKILIKLTSEKELNPSNNDFDLHLDYSKVWSIIKEIDGQSIKRDTVEKHCLIESIVLHCLLKKASDEGISEVDFRESELISRYFIFGFFFNFENRKTIKGNNVFCIENRIFEIFTSLKEIADVMKEKFDVILHAHMSKNEVRLSFGELYEEMLKIIP